MIKDSISYLDDAKDAKAMDNFDRSTPKSVHRSGQEHADWDWIKNGLRQSLAYALLQLSRIDPIEKEFSIRHIEQIAELFRRVEKLEKDLKIVSNSYAYYLKSFHVDNSSDKCTCKDDAGDDIECPVHIKTPQMRSAGELQEISSKELMRYYIFGVDPSKVVDLIKELKRRGVRNEAIDLLEKLEYIFEEHFEEKDEKI